MTGARPARDVTRRSIPQCACAGAGLVALALALAACGGGSAKHQVTGVLWEWNGLLENHPTHLSAVPDPSRYLLTLNDDGTFNATADCNQLSGTYTLSGSKLSLK